MKEERFDDFRDAACAGVCAHLFTLLQRIEAFADNSPELRRYLRDRVRSIPEIGEYLRDGARPGYLSPYRRWKHGKVVAFLEGSGRFPLPITDRLWLKGLGAVRRAGRVWGAVFSPHKGRVVATVPNAGKSAGAGRGFRDGASTQAVGAQRGAGQGGAAGLGA